MWNILAGPLLGMGEKVIDRLWPDPTERDKAKLELIRLQQEGAFKETEQQMSAIMAEANSDSWFTSGARPSLMWVFSILVLAALPIGVISAITTDCPQAIIPSAIPPTCNRVEMLADGMKAYWGAFPTWFSELATYCFLGYAGFRSGDKMIAAWRAKKNDVSST